MIDCIHIHEVTKPKQHTGVYSAEWPGVDNSILIASSGEAISPNNGDGYITAYPPASDVTKAILANTDHILWPYVV